MYALAETCSEELTLVINWSAGVNPLPSKICLDGSVFKRFELFVTQDFFREHRRRLAIDCVLVSPILQEGVEDNVL